MAQWLLLFRLSYIEIPDRNCSIFMRMLCIKVNSRSYIPFDPYEIILLIVSFHANEISFINQKLHRRDHINSNVHIHSTSHTGIHMGRYVFYVNELN